jgi:DNA-binding NarL/FixJ family response regulator
MTDRSDGSTSSGLVDAVTRPQVIVLGAGGLARRLAVGPLREHGFAVHDHDDEPEPPTGPPDPDGSAEPPGASPVSGNGGAVGDDPVPGGPAVGLLVNPGTEHWAQAASRQVPLVVLVLERPTDEAVVDAVLRGAEAVVTAHEEPEELVAALEAVAAGGTLLTPHQMRWVAEAARGRRREADPVETLTRRELDILLSIDRGETVKQTARSLGISAKTVENLQSRLFRKLSVRNRAQAVSQAHELGLLNLATDTEVAGAIDLTSSTREMHTRWPR